jgi:hypothetical protein
VFLLGYPPSGGGITPKASGAKAVKPANKTPRNTREFVTHVWMIVFIDVFLFCSADVQRSMFKPQRSAFEIERAAQQLGYNFLRAVVLISSSGSAGTVW